MKLKIFLAVICVMISFVSVFSQTTSNCIKERCTVNNNGAQGCNIEFEFRDCQGQREYRNPSCTNGIQGQSNCQCTCTPPPNNGWATSYDLTRRRKYERFEKLSRL